MRKHLPDGTRPAPTFQEYASDLLASEEFRTMTLAERGLLFSMRLQCWHGISIPSAPDQLARLLSVDKFEIQGALTERVLTFFETDPYDLSRLICPALEIYRKQQIDRHAERAKSGRKGANSRWNKKKSGNGSANSLAIQKLLTEHENKNEQIQYEQIEFTKEEQLEMLHELEYMPRSSSTYDGFPLVEKSNE